jgi:hypothetical protein
LTILDEPERKAEGHAIKFTVDELIDGLSVHDLNITGRTAKKLRDVLTTSQTADDAITALKQANPTPSIPT